MWNSHLLGSRAAQSYNPPMRVRGYVVCGRADYDWGYPLPDLK